MSFAVAKCTQRNDKMTRLPSYATLHRNDVIGLSLRLATYFAYDILCYSHGIGARWGVDISR